MQIKIASLFQREFELLIFRSQYKLLAIEISPFIILNLYRILAFLSFICSIRQYFIYPKFVAFPLIKILIQKSISFPLKNHHQALDNDMLQGMHSNEKCKYIIRNCITLILVYNQSGSPYLCSTNHVQLSRFLLCFTLKISSKFVNLVYHRFCELMFYNELAI